MKKFTVLILTIALLCGMMIMPANAVKKEKITPELQKKLNSMQDNDKTEIWVEYNPLNVYDESELRRKTDEAVGFSMDDVREVEKYDNKTAMDMVNIWRRMRNKLMQEITDQFWIDFYKELNIEDSEIVSSNRFVLSKAKILSMTEHEKIKEIKADFPAEDDNCFYLVFEKDNWAVEKGYRMRKDGYDTYTFGDITMTADDRIKVVFSRDGKTAERQYPSEEDEGFMPGFSSRFMNVWFSRTGSFAADTSVYKGYIRAYPCEPPIIDDPTEPSKGHGEVPAPVFRGDADTDGEVTILDATTIQRRLAGIVVFCDERNADYDLDREVTILDATAIQRSLVGLA